jgi:hypothetical protein
MATTMMRFPHETPKYSGLVVLSNKIALRRLATIYRSVLANDLKHADRVLKDTIRLFRTAKNNTIEKQTYNYVLSNMLRMAVELHLLQVPAVTGRMRNMYISLALPEELI